MRSVLLIATERANRDPHPIRNTPSALRVHHTPPQEMGLVHRHLHTRGTCVDELVDEALRHGRLRRTVTPLLRRSLRGHVSACAGIWQCRVGRGMRAGVRSWRGRILTVLEVIRPLLFDRRRPAGTVTGHSYETSVVEGTRANAMGRAFVHAARAPVTHPCQDLKLDRVQRDIANGHDSIVHAVCRRAQRPSYYSLLRW